MTPIADLDEIFDARPKRYSVELEATLIYRTPAGEHSIRGLGRNISKNGMAVLVPEELTIGMELKLALPVLGECMYFDAMIRNREQYTYGLAFLNPPEHQRTTLATYCSAMALASAL